MSAYDRMAWLRAGRPRWVVVAVTGPGPLEAPRVFGPWRSEAKARAACDRLLDAVGNDMSIPAEVTLLDPEHGGLESLTALIREVNRRA